MKDKHGKSTVLCREKRLLEKLRSRPELMERFEAILELTESEGGKLRTADEVEDLLVEEVRRLGNRAMHDWAGGAEQRAAEELRQGVSGARLRKKKALTWWCVFGAISVCERIWRAPGRSYLRPFTSRVGVSARGKSRRLQRALSDFGAEHSFAQSCQRLKEHYGFELGASAVRDTTLQHASRAAARLQADYAQSFRVLPRRGPANVVAEADGTMICTVPAGRSRKESRPREWKEMRLSAAQAQGSVKSFYAAGFNAVDETGRRWGHCTREAGWSLESRIHVVADGAEWIALQSREVFGDQADMLVDFYHVSEYLAAAADHCRPASPHTWLRTQQKRLKRGAAKEVLATMEAFAEPEALADEEAPVRSAIRYLFNRLEQLDYPRAIARQLPIGSGLIESGHKHVLHARLKQAGSAWLPQSADTIAQLRVLRANQHWEDFWNDHKAA